MKLLFLFFALLVVSSVAMDMSIIDYDATHMTSSTTTTSDGDVKAMFESWIIKHGKFYNALGEKEARFQIFKDNIRFIENHNSGDDHSYKLELNKFADLTDEEFRLGYTGTRMEPWKSNNNNNSYSPPPLSVDAQLPNFVDWRKKGAVSAVKDQGQCGSCWAFATIGAVEGINQIRTGRLITLSEQELVDCETSSKGCMGGVKERAFKFIIRNGGIDTDKDYPYTAKKGFCNTTKKNKKVVSIDGYRVVPVNNEAALRNAAARQPIAVAIDATSQAFRFYKSGIFTGRCGTRLNHGVVVVGYGTLKNGTDYWILKNSWGTDWGYKGYIRMKRNIRAKTGKCGIAMRASYPIKNVKSSVISTVLEK